MLANPLEEEQTLEKKRQGEGCEIEEEPKRQKVKDIEDSDWDWDLDSDVEDEDDEEDEDEDEDEVSDEFDNEYEFYKDYSDEDDGYEDFSEIDECCVSEERMGEGCYIFSLPTNKAMNELCKSFSYADILPSHQVRSRILNFLNILSEETKAADEAFVRVSKVMKMCLKILMDIDGNGLPPGTLNPARLSRGELSEMLRDDSSDYFSSRLQVNRTIQDVVALLRCSPYSLGITEFSRGFVAGRIVFQEPKRPAVDCSKCEYAISTDLKLLKSLVMESDARCIIVAQRGDVFSRLAKSPKFMQRIPSILLTARGYPDTATRFLLHRMSKAFPDLPILAVVDWKPAGLAVLLAYKYGFGSTGTGIGAYGYACNVKWLGMRGDDLKLLPPNKPLRPLKSRDRRIAESLISSGILEENYRKELELMMQRGVRAHIERLDKSFGRDYAAKKIEQGDYI